MIAVAIDCTDPEALADFWCRALDYTVLERWQDNGGLGYVEIGVPGPVHPVLLFQPVAERKTVKNRLHLDVAPVQHSQQEEVCRLVELGATWLADEPDLPWVVLADPEGNEFCVVKPRPEFV
jgi:hypothetical protein